jgi:DNA modification methylase
MANIGSYPLNEIVTGDSRLLAQSIPDESIDLIFTDPVYENIEDYAWLAETAARILKPDCSLLAWCGTRQLFEAQSTMLHFLEYGWLAIWYQGNSRSFIKSELGHHHYAPLLWMKKGNSKPNDKRRDIVQTNWNQTDYNHKWSKHPKVISYYLEAFTQIGSIVYEPFAGGGTIPAVCKMMDRNFIASEHLQETAELARSRLLQTQPPLGLGWGLTQREPDKGDSPDLFSLSNSEKFPALGDLS